MQLPIHPNDLPVLAKIFNPSTKYILILEKNFDKVTITETLGCQVTFFENNLILEAVLKCYPTENCTLINFTNTALSSNNLTTIQIDRFQQQASSSTQTPYDFINNPDGTIRWLFPTTQKYPTFLHLYNASGWKGKMIKKGIQVGFHCGLGHRIKQGTIQVFAPYAPAGGELQKESTLFKSSDYAIFTGTKGENRKAVFAFEKNKKATHFLKVPLTKAAHNLVKNESVQLKTLATYSFQILVIPQARQIHDNLLQTNICPAVARPNLKLTTIHLRGLQELYQETIQWQLLQSTPVWASIEDDLSALQSPTIKNDLSLDTVQQLAEKLLVLKSQIDTALPVPLVLTHGDFTPWNTYLTKDQIRVYDWELAGRMPLLYDAFHFIFQTSILVKKLPYSAIQQQIDLLRQHPIVQSLQKEFSFSFDDAYEFYLMRTISYYLRRYIQQTHLHEQAHWLIDTWIEALTDCLYERKNVTTPIETQ